jgi:hypothetical protein
MCNMPRRTRASGVVIRYDRDACDAAVFECGLGDHGGICRGLYCVCENIGQESLQAVASY